MEMGNDKGESNGKNMKSTGALGNSNVSFKSTTKGEKSSNKTKSKQMNNFNSVSEIVVEKAKLKDGKDNNKDKKGRSKSAITKTGANSNAYAKANTVNQSKFGTGKGMVKEKSSALEVSSKNGKEVVNYDEQNNFDIELRITKLKNSKDTNKKAIVFWFLVIALFIIGLFCLFERMYHMYNLETDLVITHLSYISIIPNQIKILYFACYESVARAIYPLMINGNYNFF